MARSKEIPLGQFAQKMVDRMEELNLTIKDVSDAVGATYEHIRQLSRGGTVPSKYMVNVLAKKLRMNEDECERLATADRIRMKYGKHALHLWDRNPEIEPLEAVWQYLSSGHKQDLIGQAQAWARRDRGDGRR